MSKTSTVVALSVLALVMSGITITRIYNSTIMKNKAQHQLSKTIKDRLAVELEIMKRQPKGEDVTELMQQLDLLRQQEKKDLDEYICRNVAKKFPRVRRPATSP